LVDAIFTLLVSGSATRKRKTPRSIAGSRRKASPMFWKIYAVLYMALIVLGLPTAIHRLPQASPIDLIDMAVFTPIAMAGLWSVAFRHISLPKNTWKVLLFVSVFWRAVAIGNAILFGDMVPKFQASLVAISNKMGHGAANTVLVGGMALAFAIATFLMLPPLIALYRNAYGDESLLKLMSPSSVPPAPASSPSQPALSSRQTVA
jgi:hypothetical protein